MKTRKLKSVLTLILAVSLIVGSSLGLQMLNGFAEGVSGNPNPTLGCTITNLNGSSIFAYADSSYTRDDTYPRLVTNGNQIRVRFWGYDTEGISYINIKLIKVQEHNQLIGWLQPGYPDLIYDNNFAAENSDIYEHVFTITEPDTYAVLATIVTPDGRTTQKYKFFLYGTGTVVGGDFNNRITLSTGQSEFCTLYDLGGAGINIPATSLLVTKAGLNYDILSNNGLTITQDPSFPSRYKVFGIANRSALQNIPGQYEARLQVLPNNSGTFSTIYFPPTN